MSLLERKDSISDEDYKFLSDLVYRFSKIHLGESKHDMVESRLQSRLKEQGFSSMKEYCKSLRLDPSVEEVDYLINAIATNYTYFFRDNHHYEFIIKNVLPDIVAGGELSIWSAACSSGDEAYSLAILFNEYLSLKQFKWNIMCSDISSIALNSARNGEFSQRHLNYVNEEYLNKYFECVQHQGEKRYRLDMNLQRNMEFVRQNLMSMNEQYNEEYDLIFCRNLMIYFDSETQEKLIDFLYRALKPKGYLFIGSSETLRTMKTDFKYVEPTIYQKNG